MTLLNDAVELVCWYEAQPDCGTYAKDEAIATHLGWLLGGWSQPKDNGKALRRGGDTSRGDAARVRRARRFVDKNNGQQPFIGYAFGTKRNGGGMRFSMLVTPRMASAVQAHDESVSEALGRSVQQANQAASERARNIAKLGEQEQAYIAAGEYEKALVVHDCVKELQTFGNITMATLSAAREHGILVGAGGL